MGNEQNTSQINDKTAHTKDDNCIRCNKLITDKDFATSNFIINPTQQIQHKRCNEKASFAKAQPSKHNNETKQQNDDEKLFAAVDTDVSDDDDDAIRDLMVTGTDQWQPIYEAWCNEEAIIDCIGQLRMCYKETKHGFSMNYVGTGTVFWESQSQRAFVITVAHNIRHLVRHCLVCDKYMDKENMPTQEINKKTIVCCIHCNQRVVAIKYIEAKSIEFKRRSNQKHPYLDQNTGKSYHFGDNIHTYDPVKCEFIGSGNLSEPGGDSINCYRHCVRCDGGYDWAVLSFHDDDKYYDDKCKNIVIKNGVKTMKWLQRQHECFNIFGIPGPDKGDFGNKLVGMKSIGDEFEIKEHETTHEKYLYQRVIDCEGGQSGSSLWTKYARDQKYFLFGVHTGGKTTDNMEANLAVLFSDFAVENIRRIISEQKETTPVPIAPIISIRGMILNIKANENYIIRRFKVRVHEKDEDEKRMDCNINDVVIDSSNTKIKYDMMAFIKERRLREETPFDIEAAAGNNYGFGSFSKVLSFTTPDLNTIAPVLFSAISDVKKWMERIVGRKYDNLYDSLRKCNGSDLCELFISKTCKEFIKTNVYNSANMNRNIEIFVNGCSKFGVDKGFCVRMDVFDKRENITSLIINLYAISIMWIRKNIWFTGPFIPLCARMKWKGRTNEGFQAKYIGGVNKDGIRNGIGKQIWFDGDVYEGEWTNLKQNGYAKYMFNNGAIYEGNFKDGMMNGYGKYIYKNGQVYCGYYENDDMNGYGKWIWFKSGNVYEGDWKANKRHGYGTETDKHGNIIWKGQYKNDSRCT